MFAPEGQVAAGWEGTSAADGPVGRVIADGFARRVGLTHTPDEWARHAVGSTRKHSAASTIRIKGNPSPSYRYLGRRSTQAAMIVKR